MFFNNNFVPSKVGVTSCEGSFGEKCSVAIVSHVICSVGPSYRGDCPISCVMTCLGWCNGGGLSRVLGLVGGVGLAGGLLAVTRVLDVLGVRGLAGRLGVRGRSICLGGSLFMATERITRRLNVSGPFTCGLIQRVGRRLRTGNFVAVTKQIDEGCCRRGFCNVTRTG